MSGRLIPSPSGLALPGVALLCLVLFCLALVGCAGPAPMTHFVPQRCNLAAAPFETFTIQQHAMPGFIEPVVAQALAGALERQGLQAAEDPAGADVTAVTRFSMIDRMPDPGSRDAFGDAVAPGEVTRFVAHVDLQLVDNRDDSLIWQGSMDRPHAIVGGETFHDERAVLIVSTTLDTMLQGVKNPCG